MRIVLTKVPIYIYIMLDKGRHGLRLENKLHVITEKVYKKLFFYTHNIAK